MNHRKHWEKVRALGCCLSNTDQGVTIHHCHGGSMVDFFGKDSPDAGCRNAHFLVIPLAAKYHYGEFGLDTGMGAFKGIKDWERTMGTQVSWLLWVNDRLDYDIFELAGVPTPPADQFDCEKWMAYD